VVSKERLAPKVVEYNVSQVPVSIKLFLIIEYVYQTYYKRLFLHDGVFVKLFSTYNVFLYILAKEYWQKSCL